MMNIYDEMVKQGVPIDNHATDLYALVTPESTAIVNAYDCKCNVTKFRNQIDSKMWFDIPFAFTPAWDRKAQS